MKWGGERGVLVMSWEGDLFVGEYNLHLLNLETLTRTTIFLGQVQSWWMEMSSSSIQSNAAITLVKVDCIST